jgi:hypothetical protein
MDRCLADTPQDLVEPGLRRQIAGLTGIGARCDTSIEELAAEKLIESLTDKPKWQHRFDLVPTADPYQESRSCHGNRVFENRRLAQPGRCDHE